MKWEDLCTVGPFHRKSTLCVDRQFGYTFARLHYDTNDNLFALYVYSFTANKERLTRPLISNLNCLVVVGSYFLSLSKTTGTSLGILTNALHHIFFLIPLPPYVIFWTNSGKILFFLMQTVQNMSRMFCHLTNQPTLGMTLGSISES